MNLICFYLIGKHYNEFLSGDPKYYNIANPPPSNWTWTIIFYVTILSFCNEAPLIMTQQPISDVHRYWLEYNSKHSLSMTKSFTKCCFIGLFTIWCNVAQRLHFLDNKRGLLLLSDRSFESITTQRETILVTFGTMNCTNSAVSCLSFHKIRAASHPCLCQDQQWVHNLSLGIRLRNWV